MKNLYRYLVSALLIGLLIVPVNNLFAGNKDRSGQAGASELLINPWARSTGWGSVSTSNVKGLEGLFGNVAGTAFTQNTEMIFSHTQWLKGSDINMYSFGLTQKVGEGGVLGLAIMSMKFGELDVTKVDLPEGGIGTFDPSYMTIGISYAKAFSNSIYGGIQVKLATENVSDMTGQAIAIDAGIQYVTGDLENIHFGITLRNWGPTMKFSGDGLSIRSFLPNQDNMFTLEQRSAEYELPSQLMIGAAYDFLLSSDHRITAAGNFVSNAFTKDQLTGGVEYGLKEYLMLRVGYTYEEGMNTNDDNTNVYNGLSAGMTIQVPLNKEKGSTFALDYSYQDTDPFEGTHSIGVRMNL